jgi:RNA polymerase sigma factor (sigma-70 family)
VSAETESRDDALRNLTPEQEALVTENMGLVRFVIYKYGLQYRLPQHVDYDDIFSVGCLGLMRAAAQFNPSLAKFSTFAVPKIRSAIQGEIARYEVAKRGGFGRDKGFRRAASIEALREKGYDPAYVESEVEEQVDIPRLTAALNHLHEVDRRLPVIVQLRSQGKTYREVGLEVGLSHERVRQLCVKARQAVA